MSLQSYFILLAALLELSGGAGGTTAKALQHDMGCSYYAARKSFHAALDAGLVFQRSGRYYINPDSNLVLAIEKSMRIYDNANS